MRKLGPIKDERVVWKSWLSLIQRDRCLNKYVLKKKQVCDRHRNIEMRYETERRPKNEKQQALK